MHWDESARCFLQVQGGDVHDAKMMIRRAPRPEGPWSEPVVIFDPPERQLDGVIMYAFKAHPHLDGGGLAATYVVTPTNPDVLLDDETFYYPRFVRITGTSR